jgi:hypothetical protein
MPRALLVAAIALLFGSSAWAQTRPASEAIGSWVLSCPDAKTLPCQLRHRASIQPGTSGPSASLEVVHRGDLFVPVVTLRGMSMQAALGGVLAVQSDVALSFDNLAPIALGCGLDGGALVCAPAADAATAAAAELSAARSVMVRIRLSIPGVTALPDQSRSLDLQQTAEALAAFRATAPASESVPVIAGLDWRGFLDRVARDAGFRNGLTDVMPSAEALFGGRRP